jgi:hypothetical protein
MREYIYILVSWGGMSLSPFAMPATNWPIEI